MGMVSMDEDSIVDTPTSDAYQQLYNSKLTSDSNSGSEKGKADGVAAADEEYDTSSAQVSHPARVQVDTCLPYL